jgi:hypothetical protein
VQDTALAPLFPSSDQHTDQETGRTSLRDRSEASESHSHVSHPLASNNRTAGMLLFDSNIKVGQNVRHYFLLISKLT